MSAAEVHALLSWISERPRTYDEAIEVWKTHCPRHSTWEDALAGGLIRVVRANPHAQVALTPLGKSALDDT